MATAAQTDFGAIGLEMTRLGFLGGGDLLNVPGSRTRATVVAVALAVVCGWVPVARAQAPDSLLLQAPTGVTAYSIYQPGTKTFLNYILWDDVPDNVGTLVEPPSPWALNTSPSNLLSVVGTRGPYSGDIDRTVLFTAQKAGRVGVDSVVVSYEIKREENFNGRIVLLPSYVPGTWVPIRFAGGTVDFGLQVNFGSGIVDRFSTFGVGLQDFEGYHIWRGIEKDGSDLTIIGELSKEEAFLGDAPGGALLDSVYYYDVVPTLRTGRPWVSPFGAIDCVGTRFDLNLAANQYFWYDCNAADGFTYYYAVTTFDRGYTSSSSQEGLVKVDNCYASLGTPFACPDELYELVMKVNPQDDLYNVYVVPNPYRSGGSRLTASNYHNFPDNLVRFVNLPHDCTLRVFTVAGDLVWENIQNNAGGVVEWDLTNRNSESVASGVYIFRVEKPSGDSMFGRLVVIR